MEVPSAVNTVVETGTAEDEASPLLMCEVLLPLNLMGLSPELMPWKQKTDC